MCNEEVSEYELRSGGEKPMNKSRQACKKASIKTEQNTKENRHIATKVIVTALDYGITVYLILLIGVMPFYFTRGYGYIATDKAKFFNQVSVSFGKVFLTLLIAYVIATIARRLAKYKRESFKKQASEMWNRIKCRVSALDIFVGLYGLAVFVSYFCSEYREDALWGAGGWYMGLIPQLIAVCIYFGISFPWKPRKGIFYLIFAASAVVFALGFLNRFDIRPIEMEWSSSGYISTIGNINWYCGYAVLPLFAGVGLLWQGNFDKPWKKCLLSFYISLGVASLVVQGSLSGIVALGGMMVILFCLSAKDRKLMKRYWSIVVLLSLACLFSMLFRWKSAKPVTIDEPIVDLLTTGWLPIVMTLVSVVGCGLVWMLCKCSDRRNMRLKEAENQESKEQEKRLEKEKIQPEKIFRIAAGIVATLVSVVLLATVGAIAYNTLHPGSIGAWSEIKVFTFSPTWGSSRGATWMAGIGCFAEQELLHKIVGVGPDAMSAYLLQDGSEELLSAVQDSFGNKILTNCHNEWLTILVNLGVFGLTAFVGLVFTALRMFLKGRENRAIAVACACGLLAHTINCMFSFQQTMNLTMLFILLGIGRAFLKAANTGNAVDERQCLR